MAPWDLPLDPPLESISFQQNQNYQSHTPHLIILPDNESVVVVLLFLSVIGYVDL